MRRNVVAIVLLAVMGAAIVLLWAPKSGTRPRQYDQDPQAMSGNSVASRPATNVAIAHAERTQLQPSVTNHVEYVRQRRDQLMDLAMHNDAASLETILSELENSDPQIRKAALEATVQFSDRSAIPRLRDLASRTTDEDEKAELENAADYLALPSVTEVMAQQQAQRAAVGITNTPPQPRTNPIVRRRPLVQPAPTVPASSSGNP